jgi:hypothetical protein
VALLDQLRSGTPPTLPPIPASTTTEPAPPPAQSSPPDSLASLPAFRPPRAIPPSAANPDPPPNDDEHQGAAAGSTKTSIPAFFRKRADSYAKIAGVFVKAVGGYLNAMSGEIESEAFLPDDDDLADIPPPLGRLAARRIRLGADPDQLSDIEDIGMAAVGIGIWLVKGLSAVLEARRERRRLEAGRAVHADAGDGQ